MPFDYNKRELEAIEKYISPERLAAYFALARGKRWVAFKLYEKNTELAGALYEVIQALEVTVRNAIHVVMSERFGSNEWYDRIHLGDSERNELEEAKDSLRKKGQAVTPGRIVSELTFGFWVKLTGRVYEDDLWVPHLSRIFPIRLTRPVVHERLVLLKTLRNRIAHHERIIGRTRSLPLEHKDAIEAICWISPEMAEWVEHRSCFNERYANRFPQKPPEPPAQAAAAPIPSE